VHVAGISRHSSTQALLRGSGVHRLDSRGAVDVDIIRFHLHAGASSSSTSSIVFRGGGFNNNSAISNRLFFFSVFSPFVLGLFYILASVWSDVSVSGLLFGPSSYCSSPPVSSCVSSLS
jgi:hypothetical protein